MEDQALAMSAAQGDQQAFTILVERYRRYIYAIAYRVVLHEDDALDVTQNVFLQMARKIGDYDGRGSFKGWLAAITVRQGLDHHRRGAHLGEPTEPEVLARLAERHQAEAPDSARQALEKKQRRERVAAAMAGLSAQQRAIFALRFYEEMGPKEIGARLGLPPPQVRSQLFRAMTKIREIVNGEE